jgi:hypothetical protein
MKMPTTLQEDAEKFAAFIIENYPDAKQWIDPVEKAAWYISHCFAASVCCEAGHMVALLAARPVERPGLGVLPYYFNEGGQCLHVDLWIDVSGDDRARLALKAFALVRWPQCTTIAMFRHFEESIRVYDIECFWRSFEKIKKVKRKRKNEAGITSETSNVSP